MHRIAALLLALTAPLVAGTLTLPRYLADVRAANPELRAATERTAAAEARIAQARAWADPVASLELMRKDTELFGYDEVQVGVTQMLPLSRQRSARTATARAASDLAKAESRALASDLTIRASRAYFTLATARTELELTRSFRPILAHAADAARARLADGSGDVASVLLAETESAKLQQQEIENLRAIADAESAFNALRHQPPAAPVDALDENPPATPAMPASLEAALEQALAHRPELQAAEAQIALASRQAEQSRAWAPDPELMIKLRHMNGMNRAVTSFDTGIALPLPWANRGKYRAAEREAAALRRAAEADAAAVKTDVLMLLPDKTTKEALALCKVLPDCRSVAVPGSLPALHLEQDRFRQPWMDQVTGYIAAKVTAAREAEVAPPMSQTPIAAPVPEENAPPTP